MAKVLVDADALPAPARDILFRAAGRVKIKTILVANKTLRIPESEFITFQMAEQGFDEADAIIISLTKTGDIVITADIPLASQAIANGATAIDPRGQLYDIDSIKERLAMRDFMDTLRKSGVITGGPPPYDKKACQAFAAQLDKLLAKIRP